MPTFQEIDRAAMDGSIYQKTLPELQEYRRELDRVAAHMGDKSWRRRWEALHKLVCDLIANLETKAAQKNEAESKQKMHNEQIAESHRANRLSVIAIVVAVVAVAIAIAGWRFPREIPEPNRINLPPTLPLEKSEYRTEVLTVQPVTNSPPTNTPSRQEEIKPQKNTPPAIP